MIGFHGSAKLRVLPKAEITERGLPLRWFGEILEDIIVDSDWCGTFTIPAGFLTDDATVPKLFWNILSFGDPVICYPAYGHDYLYATQGHLPGRNLTKDQADQFLREQMKLIGAKPWQYDAVYRAVHLFGGARFSAKLVGMNRAWSDPMPVAKFANVSYAHKPTTWR